MEEYKTGGKLIGHKGTPAERRQLWLSMLMTKESNRLFSKHADPEYREVGKLDGQIYNNYLNKYIKHDTVH